MKKILIATIGLFGLLDFSTQAQTVNTSTTTTKTSATLAAICTIASQNVNFGQLILPISSY
jgi:multisubunit Na+/H+ antiporter MnhG subunit